MLLFQNKIMGLIYLYVKSVTRIDCDFNSKDLDGINAGSEIE
jgi:hypothetical protein